MYEYIDEFYVQSIVNRYNGVATEQLTLPRSNHLGRIGIIKSGRRSEQPLMRNFENCVKVATIT